MSTEMKLNEHERKMAEAVKRHLKIAWVVVGELPELDEGQVLDVAQLVCLNENLEYIGGCIQETI